MENTFAFFVFAQVFMNAKFLSSHCLVVAHPRPCNNNKIRIGPTPLENVVVEISLWNGPSSFAMSGPSTHC